jgi:hypothetical protein
LVVNASLGCPRHNEERKLQQQISFRLWMPFNSAVPQIIWICKCGYAETENVQIVINLLTNKLIKWSNALPVVSPQLRRLVVGFLLRRPGFKPRSGKVRPGQVRSGHVGFVLDKVVLGRFLRVLRFPLPNLIPSTAPHSSTSIIRGWYNMRISGRRSKWAQSHPKKLKKNALPEKVTYPRLFKGFPPLYVTKNRLPCF